MSKIPMIAILTNNDDDIYCFRLELIQGLMNAGYQILISCPDGPKFKAIESEYSLIKNIDYIYDNPPIDRRGTNLINDTKLIIHYFYLLKKYKPDVILTYTAKPNVYASLTANVRNIPVINNISGLGSILNEKGLKKAIIMQLFKMAYKKSACIMFQNSTNMKLAKSLGWVKGDYRLIPGSGVALNRYPIQPYPKGGNGIEGDKVVFNYIGRILHDKGVDDYIEAAKTIKKKYPNTEFNMLGFVEPTEEHYVHELNVLTEQEIVNYRGPQMDVRPWIARSHAIIHPSTYGEGMSNVLLENASSGRYIITTDNPGCRETVINGITGRIYHGGNVNELISSIEKFLLMENAERKMAGRLGRKRVEKYFNREIVVNSYLEEIGKLLK